MLAVRIILNAASAVGFAVASGIQWTIGHDAAAFMFGATSIAMLACVAVNARAAATEAK